MIHTIVPPEMFEQPAGTGDTQRAVMFEGTRLTVNSNGYITEIASSDPAVFLKVYSAWQGGFIPDPNKLHNS